MACKVDSLDTSRLELGSNDRRTGNSRSGGRSKGRKSASLDCRSQLASQSRADGPGEGTRGHDLGLRGVVLGVKIVN
jgi:hypothetical protein